MPNEEPQCLSPSEWIQQHIMKLSTEFGVDFRGCEETTKELFLKIDNNKLESAEKKRDSSIIKKKGVYELKRLVLGSNFISNGSRSKGDT